MARASGEQMDRAGRDQECSSSAPENSHLHLHRVGDVPFVWYIPDYLSAAEESSLDSTIRASKLPWTQACTESAPIYTDGKNCGVKNNLHTRECLQVSGRRLQSYGGVVHEKTGVLLTAPLPG